MVPQVRTDDGWMERLTSFLIKFDKTHLPERSVRILHKRIFQNLRVIQPRAADDSNLQTLLHHLLHPSPHNLTFSPIFAPVSTPFTPFCIFSSQFFLVYCSASTPHLSYHSSTLSAVSSASDDDISSAVCSGDKRALISSSAD